MTLIEIMIAIIVLTLMAASSGGLLVALARQSELNRQMAVVNAEVSNTLSLIHAAPFDSIGADLAVDGFANQGNFVYQKNLAANPTNLSGGTLTVAFRNAAGIPLPDPLYVDVTITWDAPPSGQDSRSFVTVRTR